MSQWGMVSTLFKKDQIMFFSHIHNLLKRGVTLQFIVAAVGDEKVEVTVLPSSETGSTGQALVPKTFTATPAELDTEFPQVMLGYATANTSLHEQLAAVQLMTKAAEQAASEQATAKATQKPGATSSSKQATASKPGPQLSDDGVEGGDERAGEDLQEGHGSEAVGDSGPQAFTL